MANMQFDAGSKMVLTPRLSLLQPIAMPYPRTQN
ncbi:hypothetical protein RSK20926_08172 [Roseobacter sp. SK209-2-6]|nr:hypothetical protein RSK20926_08172 [Roseobacter sp. SK209-2-6]